ncbi:MAG: sugar ABC transporter permease [Inquilinus sp.]|nr:sugar ABC transporter permease [Inquilinus sp.]
MPQRRRRLRNLHAIIGSIPMIMVSVGVFVFGIIYSVLLSFTNAKLFPKFNFIGLDQYERLWGETRWLVSVENIWIFGVLIIVFQMTLGYLLAVFIDQRIKQEDAFRTIFLYPFSMSLVVTGLVWQWMLDPNLGFSSAMQKLGFESFVFAPLVHQSTAIYGLVMGGVWNGVGVTMAILLAGLRGIDAEIWRATRVDGIPAWRAYLYIALPMIRGALATALILQCTSIVRVYDLVIAMTQGGPGIATQMPAIFVIEHITNRQNVALGMAAASMMLLPIVVLLAIKSAADWHAKSRREQRAA